MKKLFVIFCAILMTAISLIPSASSAADSVAGEEYLIYVSPDGSDSGDGSITNPLATPAGAQVHLRESGMLGKRPVRVKFLPGDYHLTEGLKLTKADAGTEKCPVIWEAEKQGSVRFSGTTQLNSTLFKTVTDEKILERIPSEAHGKVVQFDLSAINVNIPQVYATEWSSTNSNKTNVPPALIRNDKEQSVARWPNGRRNYATFDTVLKPTVAPANYKGEEDAGMIEFNNPRIARWATAKHAWLSGHMSVTFAIEHIDLLNVDVGRGVMFLGACTGYHPKDASPKNFQIMHLLEELDMPTEWYLDYDTQILYYYPPAQIDQQTDMELITLAEPLLNTDIDVQFHTTFKNIEFFGSRRRLVYSQGGSLTFDGCIFMYSKDREAMQFRTDKNIVQNCVFAHHDGRGITFGGEPEIKKAVREYSTIRNNYFYDVGEMSASLGHAIISGSGSGCDIYQNTMHFLPQGIFLGGWDACDIRLYYNEFYNYGHNLSDMGGFYIGYCGSAIGTDVGYNYFYDYQPVNPKIGRSQQGVYFDDGACYGYVHHNTFINGAGYGIQIGGGKYNRAEGNIIMKMGSGPFVTDARVEQWSNGQTIANQTHSQSAARILEIPRFSKIYPWTNHIYDSPMRAPYGNVIRNNLSDKAFYLNARMVELGKVENNMLVSDYSHFVDPENYDFRIKDNSVFAKTVPELTESSYDITKVGSSLDIFNIVDTGFELLSPRNGESFDSDKQNFVWEIPTLADKFTITVATDKDMKNIVYSDTVHYNWATVEGLEEGREYWWQIEAHNTSMKRKRNWKSEVQHFINNVKVNDTLDNILYYIGTSEYTLENEDLTQYQPDSADKFRAAINEAQRYYDSAKRRADLTEEEVNMQTDKLLAARDAFEKSEILNYTKFNAEYFTSGDYWELNDNIAEVSEGQIKFSNPGSGYNRQMGLNEMPGMNDVLTFRAKIDFLTDNMGGSWASFDLRRGDNSRPAYNDKGIMMIIKRNVIEFQAYPSGGIVTSVENKWIKDGQWHEIAVGAVNKADCVRLVLVVDGEVAVNHLDYNRISDFPGKFGMYLSQTAVTLSETQMDYENIETGVMYYNAGKTGYSEEGTWQISEIKGESGNDIRVASSQDARATWSIDGLSGHKRVYFRRNTLPDGDAKANLTVSTDHVDKMTGEEATKEIAIDFTGGESEWILIDENRYDNGRITLTLTGSGAGSIYADAVRVEEMED